MFGVFFLVHSSNQTAWRRANLACKLAIDNLEKDELLHGGESQSIRQRFEHFCTGPTDAETMTQSGLHHVAALLLFT